MLNTVMLIICLVPIAYYLFNLKKFKLNTKTMIVVALFAACSLVLSKIQLIQYPQGGGINLFDCSTIKEYCTYTFRMCVLWSICMGGMESFSLLNSI